ncbi:MAG: hypothetical protein HY319_13655 [Armatimonadetes bacterium]|nr:hypothetical protein [Armatimonadota bacterium]
MHTTRRRVQGAIVGGKYILSGLLPGSSDAVFRANEFGSGRSVVLKELTVDPELPEEELPRRNRLLRESVLLLKNAVHPLLATVYDYVDEGERVYVAMEWIPGTTLAQAVLMSPVRPSRERALRWGLSICDCLHHLQDRPRPFLSPALNPDHVMVTETGEARLINFGLGRIFRLKEPGLFTDESALLVDEFHRYGDLLTFTLFGRSITAAELEQSELPPRLTELLGTLLRRRTGDRPPTFQEFHRCLREALQSPTDAPSRQTVWSRLRGALRSPMKWCRDQGWCWPRRFSS